MKKIYLLVLLLVASCVSRAQNELPYFYNFNGNTFATSGWYFPASDPPCLNWYFAGQKENVMYFSSFEDCGPEYRQYVMSPRIVNRTEDSVQVRFSYMIPNEQPSTETFVVGYCTADTYTSEEDFVWLEDTVVCTNYTSWQLYQHNLPVDVQYIAIAYTSGHQWSLVIDDFLLRADSPDAFYTFTVDANEGGEVAVTTGGQTTYGTTNVQEGDALSYTVTADQGCYISSFLLDNTPNYLAIGSTSFGETLYPVVADHELQVTFGHYTYTIQIVAAEHGSIVPDGGEAHQFTVPWDTTVGFRFYPDEGYHVSQVALTAGGITTNYYDQLDTFTLANICRDYRLQVFFALNDYVITTTAGEGGIITPSGNVDVQALTSPEFTIAANPGYLIDTIYVDGEPLDIPHYSEYIYRFENVVDNHTLSATFSHQSYIVHYTCGPHGAVTAQGGVTVGLDSIQIYYEDTIVFHFDIEEGYEVSDLQLNGASLGVGNPYSLTHVTQNSLFHAVFAEKTFLVTAEIHGSGMVTPQQSARTGYFDTVSFVFTPGYCMQLDSVLLDDTQLVLSDTLRLTHFEGEHTLHAYFSQRIYTMEIVPSEHGEIIGSSEVLCGWTSSLKIVPEHCYRFKHFYLDGEDRIDLVRVTNDTLWAIVSSVMEDHTVSAEFEKIPYNVTVQSTGAGTVSPAAVGTVLCDTTIAFEIIPDECHYVSSVTLNGENAESVLRRYPCADSGFGDTLRFEIEQIEQHYVVAVEFQEFDYTLSLSAGAHGSLSATGTLQLPCGTDTVITITPEECYEIASVQVDGEDVTSTLHYNGTSATYTFANIHTAHSLNATFARQAHTVYVAPTEHGSITPSQDSVVMCGNDLTYVIVPDECYQIDSVWLDGTAVNAQLEYRPNANSLVGDSAIFILSGISANHTVSVAFKPIMYDMMAVAFSRDNGSVSFSEEGMSIHCGASVTLTMIPKECYYIDRVWYNNSFTTDYQVDENGVGTLEIQNVTEGIYISVFFEKYRYELSLAQEPQHGSINYLPAERDCGSNVRISYPAEDCYHLDSVMIGDEWIPASELSRVGNVLVYDIQNIHSDLLLDAAFSIDSIHFVSNEGAALSVTDSVLACGQDLTVFAVREDCKQLDSIRINETLYSADDIDGQLLRLVGDTLYVQFEDLHVDCNLAVFYSQMQYELLTSVRGSGHISQPSYQLIDCGDSVAIVITPDDCQHFVKVTINDSVYPMDNDTLLIIRDIRLNMNLVFYFSSDMYEVTAQNDGPGVVDGVTGQVTCGTDLTYIFKPLDDCSQLDSVFLDGICVNEQLVNNPLPTLLLDSISNDHDIRAVFKKIMYQIEVVTDSFNFVDVEPVNDVECGNEFTVRITLDQCHRIEDVLLDGNSVIEDLVFEDDIRLLRIHDVRQDHHIEVSFSKRNRYVFVALIDSDQTILALEGAAIVCGSDTTLEFPPYDDCYGIDSVYMNNSRVEVQTSYPMHIEEDVVLVAYMHWMDYAVKVHQNGHFTMTEGEPFQNVSCGDTLSLGFAPVEGYTLAGLEVDGEVVPDSIDHFVFEDIHANHTVSVLTDLVQYQVVTITSEGGVAMPDTVISDFGTNVTIQFIPAPCYKITSVTVDGVDCFDSLQYSHGYETLTIHSLSSDKVVMAGFSRIEYTCTVYSGEGGSVQPSSMAILCGDTLNVAVVPDACYHVDTVWMNGIVVPLEQMTQIGSVYYYHIEDVQNDCHVEARFARNEYSVIVENNGAGMVVTSANLVTCGDGYSFYIVPATCTHLQSVLLNNENITAHLTYHDNVNPWLPDTAFFTVVNMTENHLIEVSYENDGDRHIDLSYLSGNTVLHHEIVAIPCGGEATLTIPFDCYTLDSVLVDGVRIYSSSWHFTGIIADYSVQVMLSRTQYQITALASSHGTITPSGVTSVDCGTDKTYSITPEEGYYIASLFVDNEEVEPTATYTFADVRQDHNIRVVFAQYMNLVDVETYGNGSVTPGDTIVAYGDAVHFDIVPEECYTVDSVVVDGVNQGSVTSFDFTSVTAPHTLYSYFSQLHYSITAGTSDNGSITLSSEEVACGEEVSFTVSPNDCYVLDSVLVNGVNAGAVVSDTIRNIRQNQVVDAYFSPIFYHIYMEEMEHGTVTVESDQVQCGENITLTILPEDCYSVDSVLINGENVGAVTTYTVATIGEDQMVRAFFSMNEYVVDVTAGGHGTVTGAGANVVQCGESFSVTITPDDCYEIGEILVDGNVANDQVQDNVLTLENVRDGHQISVEFALRSFDQQTVYNSVGGSVEPASIAAACGSDVTYAIQPISCYRIDTVWVNGVVLPADSLTFEGENATFTMYDIRQPNTVQVRFVGISYQFNVENNGDGIVHLEQNSIDCDGEATFYILPSQCHTISAAVLNNVDITESLTIHPNVNPLMPDTAFYTIPNMSQDQLLQISYQQLPDNQVTISYTDGTAELYAADSVLACGASLVIPISYNCYTVDSVLVNGENVGALSEVSISSNLADQTVRAYFSQNQYTVTAETTEGGDIVFDGSSEVACGGNVTCNIVPSTCYSIDSVVVNSVNLGMIFSYDFENITENQSIKAYFSKNKFTIATRKEGNGEISLDGTDTVLCGETRICEIVPDACNTLDSVVVNGENQGAIISFTLDNITRNQEIVAYFSLNEYQFVASAENGGTIEPAGTTTVACGSQQTYTILPEECYVIDSVLVNGTNVGDVASYTLQCTDAAGDQTVQAFFSQKEYNVRIEAGEGGSITPFGDTVVSCGGSLALSITPDDCYDIASVLVDGSDRGAVSSVVLEPVTESHTVSATFVRKEFELTPLASTGGSITPNVTTTVACGSDFTFYFEPNEGYSISAVIVDGDTMATDLLSYIFETVTGDHTIKPLFSRNQYAITVTAGEGGSASPESSMVEYMGRLTITITPDDCYHIDSVFADGVYVGSYPSYTFYNVNASHSMAATFAINESRIMASTEGNGTIAPVGDTVVACGENVTYSIVPETGWHIGELLVDGESVEIAETYTFADVRDDHTIKAQFAINGYTVTATAGEGGSVTPTHADAAFGESVTVRISAADCYRIDSVFADGAYVGAVESYTFENMDDDHTLSATFVMNEYGIVATAGEHGTITPAGDTVVTCGENVTYSIAPETGWHISSLLVDGTPVEAAGTYSFTDIHADHTILAQFAINEFTVTATAGEGGSVTPASTTVAYGESVTVAITAADCYHIDSVFADGAYVGAVESYIFENMDDDHTLAATFVMYEYGITASVEGNGTITPMGDTTVICGGNLTYSVAPATGWHISGLVVDDDSLEAAESYAFTDVRNDHTIKALFVLNDYTVTATAGEGGSVTPMDTAVVYNESVTVAITAADCYHIDSVFADGTYVGAVESYTFENIADNHTLAATFAINEFVVSASVEGNGTITPSGMTTVECGENLTYSIVPETGWHISGLVVDGDSLDAAESYAFTDVRNDHTIKALFAINDYTVTATAGEGGSVTPTSVTVAYNESVTVEITAADCYHIDSVFADGTYVGAVESHTFANISTDHLLTATFALNGFEITAEAGEHGTITPAGTTTVLCGDNITYSIIPDEGWHVSSLFVDGNQVDNSDTYTFVDVRDNHTIAAQFAINDFEVTATAGMGGQVTPTIAQASFGENITVHIVADDCYYVDSVYVDGVYVGNESSYTFENIDANHTLYATFAVPEYTIAVLPTPQHGMINPSNMTMVECGDSVLYSMVPEEGYHVSELIVDGVSVEVADTYLFADIHDNHRITAQFDINEYTVTAEAGEGGSVSPLYSVVQYRGRQTVTITPAACHRIDSVFVDGAYVGTAASYTFNNVVANHTLRAVFAMIEYEIVASVEGNGTLTPSDTLAVDCGSSVSYTATPATGWHFVALEVDGISITSDNSYTFTDIHADHTILAQFAIDEFTVTATAGAGGLVTPTDTTVNYNESVTIEITAADCYHVDSVFVDGAYVGSVESYTFENIADNHTLAATFAMYEYELTASVEGNGTITPSGTTAVSCGETVTYSIVPATGWHISGLVVDGEPVEVAETYSFNDIRTDHTILAQFAIDEFTVTATAGEGGSVTPTDTTVNYNESVAVEITVADCYHVDSVFVDGAYVGAVESYTFANIADNHTLAATFAMYEYELTASVEGNGMITPMGDTTVACGENVTYSIVPATGWHISGLVVDGEPVEVAETYSFNDIRTDHTILAQFAIDEFTVTATAGEGGSVTPTDTTVNYNESVTVEITVADCYHIDSVFVDGAYVGAVESYTFANIADNHTLAATFAMYEYELTASVEGNGTITPSGTTTVACGEDVTYSIVPATGWHISGLVVDGEPVEVAETYSFTDIRTDHTIMAQFAIDEFTVTATAGAGGSVTPTDTTVNYNESVAVEITAADCYHIDSVFADGLYVGAVESYTFENIAGNHTLAATFAMYEYELTASVEGNGTITPSGTTSVVCGEDVTYSIVPATGWHISGLVVDGETLEGAETYSFTDVRNNHTIIAQFAIDEFTVTATADEGGLVTPTDTTVNYNESVTVEITAADCYHVDSVFVDGAYVGAVESYTFENIADNHTLVATFAMLSYDIQMTVISEDNEVFYDTIFNLPCGTDTLVGVPLFYCYYVDSIVVNGTTEVGSDSILVQNLHEDMDIVFYLSREQFVLIASKQGNGTVTPMDTVHAACDDEVTFTFAPDEGWYVENLIVDGQSLGTPSTDSYTFYNLHENHTIEVIFALNVYIITSSIDPVDAGHITPYGQTVVNHGENQTYNIEPFPGYEVVDVEVDGVSQGAITTYTFYNVTANHTIVAHLMTVGVEEATLNEEVAVWPNPVENVCHIQLPDMRNVEIQLFDAQGKQILRKQVETDEAEIDFAGRPSGMYLLRVVSDGNVIATRKVIRK